MKILCALVVFALIARSGFATTKGLSQIVTPDLQGEGDLSLSLQIQDKRIANPYELQAELGLTEWAEVAVFRGEQSGLRIVGLPNCLMPTALNECRFIRLSAGDRIKRSSA